MIDVRTQLPRVYYNESRDFQLIGRLFEAILNYNKTNSDCIDAFKDVSIVPDSLVNLFALTVGFESRHEYDVHDLRIICGCFNDIVKYKGTKIAIEKAISALLNSQGIDDDFDVKYDVGTAEEPKRLITISMSSQATDIILLKDLFEYILPVGWDYTIINAIGGDSTSYVTMAKVTTTYTKVEKETGTLNKVAKLTGGSTVDNKETSTGIVSTAD